MMLLDISAMGGTHDLWNRMVKVNVAASDRSVLSYDALHCRTIKRCDSNLTDGTSALIQKRHMYYDASWRLLETRVDQAYPTSPGFNSHLQHVWGPRYIDDIILTRENTNLGDDTPNPTYDATRFHLTDAQYSTVALIDDNANLLHRSGYSAYGFGSYQYKDGFYAFARIGVKWETWFGSPREEFEFRIGDDQGFHF